VTNTGNVTLTNVTVSDPSALVAGGPIAVLAPGASDSVTFTAAHTVTQADLDAGSYINTATASGTPPTGPAVTDSATASAAAEQHPSISLVKKAEPETFGAAGDVITYTFTVTNTGNVTLTNVMVSDRMITVAGGPIASLAPGASDSTTFSGTYTVTQADVDAGSINNVASVTAGNLGGPPVTATNSALADAPSGCTAFDPIAIIIAAVGSLAAGFFSLWCFSGC